MKTTAAPSAESATRERYAAAARAPEAALCCPVNYDPQFLKVIPSEVIEKDYGCGDPSKYLHPGETVLDLGSGTGKICFTAAQVVGPQGRVIGVDMTDDMLEVARRNAPVVAERIGYANVEFRKGRIQDLGLDLEVLYRELKRQPIAGAASYLAADELAANLRVSHPLVATESVDVVVPAGRRGTFRLHRNEAAASQGNQRPELPGHHRSAKLLRKRRGKCLLLNL